MIRTAEVGPAALHDVMKKAGLTPPLPTPRPDPIASRKGYDEKK